MVVIYILLRNFTLNVSPLTVRLMQIFGFCAMVAYGFDAFLKYRAVQNGELAQGERVINKQMTRITTP